MHRLIIIALLAAALSALTACTKEEREEVDYVMQITSYVNEEKSEMVSIGEEREQQLDDVESMIAELD